MKLSIIILTKNSENVLADCIESIKSIADEIIVVDSGSEDRSVDVAKKYGAATFTHEFENFAKQRNFAMSKSKSDWVLFLDPDEQATDGFREDVRHTIGSFDEDLGVTGYFIKRKTFYFKKDWGFEDQVQRLFLRKKFKEWYGAVHETPRIEGAFGVINSPILHFTHNNLSEMVNKTNKWSAFEAELRYNSHHPKMSPIRFFRVIATGFFDSYIKGKGYKNGTVGIIESMYQAFSMFITYAKLWELQETKKRD